MSADSTTGGGTGAPAVCKDFTESQLEAAISAAKDRMCAAPTREGKLEHWREMVRLIDQRTPHRVRFMQRMRGLA